MKVVHISDIHVSSPTLRSFFHGGWRNAFANVELRLLGRAARFRDVDDVLERILEDVRRMRPDHVILSGDLTAVAADDEFAEARRLLGRLADDPARFTVIPGNHDRFTPLSHRDRFFEKHFGHLLESDLPEYAVHHGYPFVRLVGETLAVVGIDSALVPFFPGVAYGKVGRAQLEALAGLLADPRLAGRAVLVAIHHAPYNSKGRTDRWSHSLHDRDPFLKVCAEGGVAGVLHGHVHRRFRLTDPRHGVEIFSAGSSTQAGREGYWMLDLQGGRVEAAEQVDLTPPLELPAGVPTTA